MSSALSFLPVRERRRAAAVSAGLAAVLGIAGALPWLSPAPGAVRVIAVLALVAAVLLGLIAWGMRRSARLDSAELRLDDAVQAAVAGPGSRLCDCGHDHDLDELHIDDSRPAGAPACAPDETCAHDCAACVLARPS